MPAMFETEGNKAVPPPIYPITDRGLTGLSHCDQVRMLVAGGATLVQLREKNLSPRAFYDDALEAIAFAHANGVKIIINDRVDIALATGADGVHLGQTDLAPDDARSLLGEGAVLGYSTHSVAQALEALHFGADYLAIGPVFATGTKENPDPVLGVEGVSAVRDAIGSATLVAIGGISEHSVRDVLLAGADSVAVVSAVLKFEGGITEGYRYFSELARSVKQS